MSYEDNNVIVPIVLRFSNWRRQTIQDQQKKGYVQRKRTLMEILVFNYIPCAVSSTILAPLNRAKVILQVQNLLPRSESLTGRQVISHIIKEEGVTSLFKGNGSYCMKILAGMGAKTIFFDRFKNKTINIKDKIQTLKYKVFGINFILDTACAISASTIGLLMTHPYDLAYARIAGNMKFYNKTTPYYKKMRDCFHFNDNSVGKDFILVKYYHGLIPAALQSIVFSSSTLLGYQMIYRFNQSDNKKSFMTTLGGPSLVALVASVLSYPFDTLKRQMQVNGARGFKSQLGDLNQSLVNLRLNLKSYYSGFTLHMIRTIPLAPLQYLIFQSLTQLLANKHTNSDK
jgi:solute carrier family 25 (mitochondrial phosphate transporter), member 23/24/25/41